MTNHTDDKMNRTATETAVDKAQEVAGQAGTKVSETAAVVKEQAKRTVSQVGEQAKTNVGSRMGDVAQELGTVAEAVRQTSEELGSHDQAGIARYGTRIADQIEGVSNYLNDRGVEEVLTDVEGLARRQPALFLGGAFMLGLLVGRFVRSSSQNAGYQDGGFRGYQDYPSGSGYSGSGYSGSGYSGSGYEYNQGTGSGSSRRSTQSGRPSVEMGAETGANESRYRQGPSVYNTSNNEEFGDNPTAYPTGLAEE
jgi:gas vesicle protein